MKIHKTTVSLKFVEAIILISYTIATTFLAIHMVYEKHELYKLHTKTVEELGQAWLRTPVTEAWKNECKKSQSNIIAPRN